MKDAIGKLRWAIAEGYIPQGSHGPQAMQSHETACIPNANDSHATVQIRIYSRTGTRPAHTHVHRPRWANCARALRSRADSARATGDASTLESDLPIVVQHTRLDSRQAENALMTTLAYSTD